MIAAITFQFEPWQSTKPPAFAARFWIITNTIASAWRNCSRETAAPFSARLISSCAGFTNWRLIRACLMRSNLFSGRTSWLWSSQWFPKFPGDKAFVSWHQDATYWGLHPLNVTTAWIALSESTPQNGCMRVVPGTHKTPQLPQRETYGPDNMLSRGQEIAVDVDEAQAVDLALRPGEFSLHHVAIVHGSGPTFPTFQESGLPCAMCLQTLSTMPLSATWSSLCVERMNGDTCEIAELPERDMAFDESKVHAEAMARKGRNLLPPSPAPSKS